MGVFKTAIEIWFSSMDYNNHNGLTAVAAVDHKIIPAQNNQISMPKAKNLPIFWGEIVASSLRHGEIKLNLAYSAVISLLCRNLSGILNCR